MHRSRATLFDLRKSFFLDGSDHNIVALRFGGIQDQQRKFTVAGNQA